MSSLSLCKIMPELNQLASDRLHYTSYFLEYNCKTKRWVYRNFKETSFRFHFNWTFLTCFLWPLSAIYVIIYKGLFHSDSIEAKYFLLSVIVAPSMLLCNGLNLSLVFGSEEITDYLNCLFDLIDLFFVEPGRKKQPPKKILKTELRKLSRKETRGEVDLTGLLLLNGVVVVALTPFLMIPGQLIGRADPFSYPVRAIFEYEKRFPIWLQIPFQVVPAMGGIICAIEVTRTIRVVFVTLLLAAKLTLELGKEVDRVAKEDLSKGIEMYKTMYAVHVKSLKPASSLIFVAIEGGMLIAILALTGVFVGWSTLPTVYYWLTILMAVGSLGVIEFAMSYAAKGGQMSLDMVHGWKYRVMQCRSNSKRYNERVLKTLQPMAFFSYGLGYLVPETKTRMFTTIVENTVDSVLLSLSSINK